MAPAAQRFGHECYRLLTLGHHSPLTSPVARSKAVLWAGHTTQCSLIWGREGV